MLELILFFYFIDKSRQRDPNFLDPRIVSSLISNKNDFASQVSNIFIIFKLQDLT